MEYFTIVSCFCLGLLLLWTLIKPSKRKGKLIPGPKGLPIAGHAFRVSIETLHLYVAEHVDKCGDIMALDIFGKKVILLNSERMVRKAFMEDGKEYMNDRPPLYLHGYFFPDSSLGFVQKGFSAKHTSLRKSFTKGFHVYGDGIEVFEATVKSEILKLQDAIDKFQGEEFEFTELLRNSMLSLISVFLRDKGLSKEDDVLLKAIWGYVTAFASSTNAAYDVVITLFPFVRYIPGKYKEVYDQFKDNLKIIADEFFHKTKTTVDGQTPRGIVEFLRTEQQQQVQQDGDVVLTDACIIGLIADIISAGSVTTFGTLASTFLCIMNHPDVCRRIQTEILEVVGRDRLPELADKAKCPYTEAVFMEVQRYITIAPLGGPHCCRENISLDGYDIPANSVVLANLWHIHHDEKVWVDPWVFRPERFLGDDGEILPRTHTLRKSWMPFSMGRRSCAGEVFARSRIFLYVTSLLQKWTFIPSGDKSWSCDPRSYQFEVSLTMFPKPFFCRVVENKL